MVLRTAWKDKAACKDIDVELFFSYDKNDQRKALSYCKGCEVREECLNFAIEERQRFGIWGGMDQKERQRLIRKTRRRRAS